MPPPATQERPTQPATQSSNTLWNVAVRHSPLLLKNADIEAPDAETAKKIFFERCKEKHEERAGKIAVTEGMDAHTAAKTQKAIREAFKHGVENLRAGTSEIIVRPTAEVKKLNDDIQRRRDAIWGEPENARA